MAYCANFEINRAFGVKFRVMFPSRIPSAPIPALLVIALGPIVSIRNIECSAYNILLFSRGTFTESG